MRATAIAWRLVPAATLFSLFFVLDGALAWLGFLGLVPLVLKRFAFELNRGIPKRADL
jgi:hypothetical protein